jgi:hypothetical protein
LDQRLNHWSDLVAQAGKPGFRDIPSELRQKGDLAGARTLGEQVLEATRRFRTQLSSTINISSKEARTQPSTWTAPDGTIHRRISRRQFAQLLAPGTQVRTKYTQYSGDFEAPRRVISADTKYLVLDNRPQTQVVNISVSKFDEIFFDAGTNTITIKNGDEIHTEIRLEETSAPTIH